MTSSKKTLIDKELEILRSAVDNAEKKAKRETANSPEVSRIMQIVEDFFRKTKCICYGGTAINNILPVSEQFYNRELEMPDYDFYSYTALEHAKELADLYVKLGYTEVEAKAGVHFGTYKVFVNFIPIADITQMDKQLFNNIKRDAIFVNGILYAPPDYLRMSMYLELSRPKGAISRWEKVQKRLVLLNKNYPLKSDTCSNKQIQRGFEKLGPNKRVESNIFTVVKESLINQGVVFFGGYANSLFSRYMPRRHRKSLAKIPDFDVLAEHPRTTATILKERLQYDNFTNVRIVRQKGVGDIIAPHYEIVVGGETVVFIYKPLACHSYNIIKIHGTPIKVATIDTMLSFYLAFIYAGRPYYDKHRILCMAQNLFKVQEKNRLEQHGLLKRFSISCYGEQETLSTIREDKSLMYDKLKNKRHSRKYDLWFLKYRPAEKGSNTNNHTRRSNRKRHQKFTRKNNNKGMRKLIEKWGSNKMRKKHRRGVSEKNTRNKDSNKNPNKDNNKDNNKDSKSKQNLHSLFNTITSPYNNKNDYIF